MINNMDAVSFIEILRRMRNYDIVWDKYKSLIFFSDKSPDNVVKEVEKWDMEHPAKTR